MIFEWDIEKAVKNVRKHRVSFEEAKTVFDDPKMRLRYDEEHSQVEDRYIAVGISKKGHLLLVSHTYLEPEIGAPFERVRIISARTATPSQEREYA